MKPPRIHADTASTETANAPLIDRELTEAIIGAFFEVCNELGYGFLESVYCRALRIAFTARGLKSEAEAPIEVYFRGQTVGHFRADFIVAGRVIVEVKTMHALAEPEKKQLMNWATHKRRPS